jgi:CheY-like chemotaxis protein
MPEGGRLMMEASNVSVEEELIGKPANVAAGRYVMLAVTDTGMGMTEEVRARIFEPFFTTKESGKGTGLGLATLFGIVQQSGGFVTVYSEPGHGTTFKVYLPRTDRVADESMRAAADASVLGGSETILLVEDEEQVRAVACTILRRRGYNVIEAANGGEALLLANDFPSTIALLLTDVVMPRLSGRRLAEQLATQRPAMKVLFASGYTDDAVLQHGVLESGVPFIQKPFTPVALLRKVREVLDNRGPQHASGRP